MNAQINKLRGEMAQVAYEVAYEVACEVADVQYPAHLFHETLMKAIENMDRKRQTRAAWRH